MIQHVQETCGSSSNEETPTKIFEDNVECIADSSHSEGRNTPDGATIFKI